MVPFFPISLLRQTKAIVQHLTKDLFKTLLGKLSLSQTLFLDNNVKVGKKYWLGAGKLICKLHVENEGNMSKR